MALEKFRKPGLAWSLAIITALFLIAANLVLGIILLIVKFWIYLQEVGHLELKV